MHSHTHSISPARVPGGLQDVTHRLRHWEGRQCFRTRVVFTGKPLDSSSHKQRINCLNKQLFVEEKKGQYHSCL